MQYVVGVDIGGTFTDVSVIDRHTGREVIAKSPTTPLDLIEGLLDGVQRAAAQFQLSLPELLAATERFSHATTQTTNVMFTWQDGAVVGLLTTRGFGDELLIMRARGRVAGLGLAERRHLRLTDKPEQIVPRDRIIELAERVDRSGKVLEDLREEEVERAVEQLIASGVTSFAVALLWSHQNPAHEKQVHEVIRRIVPGAHVSLSSDIAPVTGEYERTSTTVVNAFVAPTLERYLARLDERLRSHGLRVPILIFQAGGGVNDVPSVLPVSTIESGPAAGMVAVQKLAERIERPRVIATDVGGTTFKVGLIVDGRWSMAPETVINQYTLLSPMIDVVSIGAGGGSIAWADAGRLRIGPVSAGAAPGPACYGWGGTRPTVTDADALLGYLNPARFLDGRIQLRLDLATEAMREHVADPLFGGDVTAAAAGVRQVVDSQMGDLIRKATLERGFDPRSFLLAAYGGAGPVHAASYARSAGVGQIMVPLSATAFSAYGVVISDTVRSVQRSISPELGRDETSLAASYEELCSQALAALNAQGVATGDITLNRWADMRYERQLHDVRVHLGRADDAGPSLVGDLSQAFADRYELLFGKTARLKDAKPRILRIGVDATAPSGISVGGVGARPAASEIPAETGVRSVYWPENSGWLETAIYDGETLADGHVLAGPAIVEQPGTSVVIPPGADARVDALRNLIITLEGATPAPEAERANADVIAVGSMK
ncbi:hydantoinase/oxoprolinase family protein [Parafrigoribacterium mesophilum]|uniref:hydantoinase/oxoprolinase family protein n=1 Tax=Parafrigoribacterium mesophilum TaxID=433646 RepID=UPI0031FC393D